MTIFHGNKISDRFIYQKDNENRILRKFLDTSDSWIYERTGIKVRHFAAEDERCSDLAYNAAVEAMKDAKISPDKLDMIIVASNTPDSTFPSMSCKVQGRLGAVNAGAFDLLAGCVGGIAGIQTAVAGISSGLWNNVLVIGTEKFKDYLNGQQEDIYYLEMVPEHFVSLFRGRKGTFYFSKITLMEQDMIF